MDLEFGDEAAFADGDWDAKGTRMVAESLLRASVSSEKGGT